MARNLDQVIGGLPAGQQQEIAARASVLIEEEMTLRDVRRAYELMQTRIAEALSMTQDGVSRIEKRSDFLLSTLRSSIEAMGGNLRLVAEFSDRQPVLISSLDSLSAGDKAPRRRKTASNMDAQA